MSWLNDFDSASQMALCQGKEDRVDERTLFLKHFSNEI